MDTIGTDLYVLNEINVTNLDVLTSCHQVVENNSNTISNGHKVGENERTTTIIGGSATTTKHAVKKRLSTYLHSSTTETSPSTSSSLETTIASQSLNIDTDESNDDIPVIQEGNDGDTIDASQAISAAGCTPKCIQDDGYLPLKEQNLKRNRRRSSFLTKLGFGEKRLDHATSDTTAPPLTAVSDDDNNKL